MVRSRSGGPKGLARDLRVTWRAWPGVPLRPAPSLCVLLAVWNALLLGARSHPELAFGGAVALLVLARPGRAPSLFRARRWPTRLVEASVGAGLGLLLHAPLTGLVASLGGPLGLAPVPLDAGAPGVAVAAACAPVFEELLYRERLPRSLGARLGAGRAALLSAALFALSHLEPWPMLGAGVVGLLLAGLYAATGSLALCVALHGGLNAAALG